MPALARQVSIQYTSVTFEGKGHTGLYITTEAGRGPRYTRAHCWYLCRGTEDQRTVWDFTEYFQCGGLDHMHEQHRFGNRQSTTYITGSDPCLTLDQHHVGSP